MHVFHDVTAENVEMIVPKSIAGKWLPQQGPKS